MSDVLEYLVRLRGAAEASAQMRGFAAEAKAAGGEAAGVGRLGTAGTLAAKGIGAIGIAAVGIGLEAVNMSTKFNHEMLKIRTDAGASTTELRNMKAGVLDLAASGASMGQGPMSLAQGLYHLESLGIRGKPALKALALASQEAAISGANLEQTTTALGAAMYVGMKGTGNLTQLMGTLNATVGAGNMRFQDLVDALGTGVLPSAKVAGLAIQDVSAALAVATDSGYQASSAAAQLGTAFHFLYAPTTKATAALASIHMTHNQLAQDMHKPQGLLVALTDLKTHLAGLSDVAKAQVLNAILPGGRGRILLTELTMLDRLKGKYAQINKTAGGFQGSVAAQRKDPGTQLKIGEAGISADMIRLGNVLTPIVIPALTKLLAIGAKILVWLTGAVGWLKKHHDAAIALGVAVGVLTVGFAAWAVAILATNAAFLVSPIGLTIIAIAALAAGVAYCWNHFKIFRDVVTAVWDWLKGAVTAVVTFVSNHWQLLASILTGPFGALAIFVITHFNAILTFITGLPGKIAQAATGLWNGLKSNLVDVLNWIGAQWNSLPLIHGFDVLGVHFPGLPMWTPISGGSTPVGAAPSPVQNTLTQHPANLKPSPGLGSPAQAPFHKAAIWGHGDIVVKVGNQEFARVQRQQIIKAMAANA